MPIDADQVLVGGGGRLLVAPVGTAVPANPASAFAAAWYDVGYLTQDGITWTPSRSFATIMAWQAIDPLRRVVTERDLTIQAGLRQMNAATMALAMGGGTVTQIAGPPAFTRYQPPEPEVIDERAMAWEVVDGTKVYRVYVPKVVVTELGDINHQREDGAIFQITASLVAAPGVKPFTVETNDPEFFV